MAKLTLNEEEIDIPVVNLKSVQAIWPVVEAMNGGPEEGLSSKNLVGVLDFGVKIIAIALTCKDDPSIPEEAIEANCKKVVEGMKANEMRGLQETVRQVLVESGLIPDKNEGNAQTSEEEANPSTETLTPSSQN